MVVMGPLQSRVGSDGLAPISPRTRTSATMAAGRTMSKTQDSKNSKGRAGGSQGKTIALNKSARHDYQLEDRYEAGLSLQGWELKAIRAGRLGIGDAYALVKNGEI